VLFHGQICNLNVFKVRSEITLARVYAAGRSSFLNTRALRASQIFHMMVRAIEVHGDAGTNDMLGWCQMSENVFFF
jgi:hypothetical protein